MKIRWKITALIAALFAVLGVAEILVAGTILMPSFTELERRDASIAMRRIEYALDSTLDQLAVPVMGWGNWGDAYRFMQDHNRAFVDENLTKVGLKELNANAVIYVDLEGRFVASYQFDFNSDRPLDLDFMGGEALAPDFPWRANLRSERVVRGLLQTNRGILMMAAAPVLDGFGRGPSRGMVMIGRLLTADEIKRIGAQAQADLAMLAPSNEHPSDRIIETENVTRVYHSFNDIYGRPIMTFRVNVPRSITQRGHMAITYASACLAAAAVIVLVLLVFILNRVVLNPLARVTHHAVEIGKGRDLTTRLDFKGHDEIGALAHEFDRMVASVAESRSKLVDQSFQAGYAELAKGVLHNLGNAMTPIGVRLSSLRDRLRSASTEEVTLAAAELAGHDLDPARRADLEEFMRLACVELAATVRSAEGDVEVMSRQTSVVQAALAEQMRATRNEHVVETVRLPELLAQSLETVPDTARQLLAIEADRSLANVGPVKVARTLLRLVLQNFIVNAADAIRESGKRRGTLHITAEIVREADLAQLHIRCTDNGIGISPDNLSRIFEKGYSTKSKETHYGIGLHWCANVIAALGGRLWATSEGRGYGASLHLMVPLADRSTS